MPCPTADTSKSQESEEIPIDSPIDPVIPLSIGPVEPDTDVIVDSSEIAEGTDDGVLKKRETQKAQLTANMDAPLISHENQADDSMEVAESHPFRPIFRSKIIDERIRRKKAAGALPAARKVQN